MADEQNRPGCYLHLIVHNSGEHPLKCTGLMLSIARQEGNRFVPEARYGAPYRRPLELKWAFEPGIHPITIDAGKSQLLDLCHAIESVDQVRFAVDRSPQGIQTDYDRGVYRVTVEVSAEGVNPAEESFLIIFDGSWHSLNVIPAPITEATPAVNITSVRSITVEEAKTHVSSLSSTSASIIAVVHPSD